MRRLLALTAVLSSAAAPACSDTTPAPDPTAVCKAYATDDAATGARFFVMQPKVDVSTILTYDDYRNWIRGLVDAQVTPCLAKTKPNFIVFPEETSLVATFIGTRAEGARQQMTSFGAASRCSTPTWDPRFSTIRGSAAGWASARASRPQRGSTTARISRNESTRTRWRSRRRRASSTPGATCGCARRPPRPAPSTPRPPRPVPFGSADASASSWRPALAMVGATTLVAAWQDFRSLENRVYIASSADGGASWSADALADDPGAGDQQYRPRVAGAAGSALVVWEDTRDGRRQLRYTVRKP